MPLIPMTIQEQVAEHVPFKRRMLRLTQAQLAATIGTSQTAIARLETGRGNPTADLIQRVITALDMDLTLYVRAKAPRPPAKPSA
ncbi:MAG TPA: helix-turn-helix transcriptional regulator [Candidatus Saccharimonadia bacterium]|nr:helix-turn-helix transcriptional regulator [Candidatus Saccharimonadia bacterium]